MSITYDISGLKSIKHVHSEVTELAAMRAEQGMRQYVPVQEEFLRDSARLSSNFAAGEVTWSTPYAMRQYMVPMEHSKAGTCDHWDEPWRKNDMPGWERYVGELYAERMQ